MIKRIVWGSLLLTALVAAALLGRSRGTAYAWHYENVLGTSMELKVLADSERAAAQARDAALTEIDRQARVLSSYDPTSEFSRWFQTSGQAQAVSPELFEVLNLFDTWRARTHGALDASAEAVSRVWKSAAERQSLPSDSEIAAAILQVRRRHWVLDAAHRTATHTSAVPLMLNSFTKSFIVDRAARVGLSTPGVRGVLVNIGGDLVARGAWTETVGVTDPIANADNSAPLVQMAIRDRAVATSGGYRRGFDIAGAHYSHIVDPRTGRPTGHVLSATVIAPVATDAGALATSFCVMTPEESARLASTISGVEFLLVLADGRRVESAGWRAMETAPARGLQLPAPVARVYAAGQAWVPQFELTVTFELARPMGRGERPYVAVWLEDKDHFPVRTLALWYQKAKYLPELRAWYRADRLRNLAEGTNIIDSVSSATRSPGSTPFSWDGTDNQGKPVKAGRYAVCIDVSREHGTYQSVRQEMDFSGVARHVDLPGNIEMATASIDYHRVGGR